MVEYSSAVQTIGEASKKAKEDAQAGTQPTKVSILHATTRRFLEKLEKMFRVIQTPVGAADFRLCVKEILVEKPHIVVIFHFFIKQSHSLKKFKYR